MAAETGYSMDWVNEVRAHREQTMRRVIDETDAEAHGEAVIGSPVGALTELSKRVGLLVVGSRAWGPVRRLLVGSTAAGLTRRSACPLIVLPRGAATGQPGEDQPADRPLAGDRLTRPGANAAATVALAASARARACAPRGRAPDPAGRHGRGGRNPSSGAAASRVRDSFGAAVRQGEHGMRIVAGFDGSEHGQRAPQRATEMAGEGGQLVVVAAAELHARTASPGRSPRPVEAHHRHDEKARAFLSERGIEAEFVEAQGDPGTAIVDAAKGADLIIVGTRGLNPVQRILLGSVSSKVVHRAECDVLVIR